MGNLLWMKLIGVKIVWIAHNLIPHTSVFDDDLLARKFLVAHVDRVVAHHPATAIKLGERFGARDVAIVAQGLSLLSLPDRAFARRQLGVAESRACVVFVGRIERYKGIMTLIHAMEKVSSDRPAALRIGGKTSPELSKEISHTIANMSQDVSIEYDALSEKEFLIHLSAADVVVLPFQQIDNSGSALSVLAAGRRLIIPGHDSLNDLPDDCVTRYWPPSDVDQLATTIGIVLDDLNSENAEASAREFARKRNWQSVAGLSATVLKDVLES
jgi:glycosyltransferase involved in cell wall biosynthesis